LAHSSRNSATAGERAYNGSLLRTAGRTASAGPEVTDDPAVVKLCATAFEAVWQRAIPHADFKV